MDISEPYCPGQTSEQYLNHPMGGDIPVTATALLLYDSASFAAITAMPVNKYTAIFLGTKHGHLLKVILSNFDFVKMRVITIMQDSCILYPTYE